MKSAGCQEMLAGKGLQGNWPFPEFTSMSRFPSLSPREDLPLNGALSRDW